MNKALYGKKDGIYAFALLLGLYLAFQVVIGLVFPNGINNTTFYWIVNAALSLIIGAAGLLYGIISKTNIVTAAKMNKAPPITHTLTACLAVFFLINMMMPVNNWFCDFLEYVGLERPGIGLPTDSLAALIIVACFLPAFTEEFIFRGTIGAGLTDGSKNKTGAVLLSGALFAFFHMNPAQTLHQFILGCLLTLFVYRSGSLFVAVAVHLFNNLCAVLLSYTLETTGFYEKYDWIIFAVSALLFAAAMLLYFKTAKKQRVENDGDTAAALGASEKVTLVLAVAVCLIFWTANLLS